MKQSATKEPSTKAWTIPAFASLAGHATPCRQMNELERITINPSQCGGRPCIRGMRIRVKDVLDMLAGGAT